MLKKIERLVVFACFAGSVEGFHEMGVSEVIILGKFWPGFRIRNPDMSLVVPSVASATFI